MVFFSRLTDIVTCNLTQLLAEAENPVEALEQVCSEMEEGMHGADRSVNTARNSEQRLEKELAEHREQISARMNEAKQHLAAGHEMEARETLQRKQEFEDLAAGLEQQYRAAVATREHLETTQRALHARLNEARRKLLELKACEDTQLEASASDTVSMRSPLQTSSQTSNAGSDRVEAELEALRRELEQD